MSKKKSPHNIPTNVRIKNPDTASRLSVYAGKRFGIVDVIEFAVAHLFSELEKGAKIDFSNDGEAVGLVWPDPNAEAPARAPLSPTLRMLHGEPAQKGPGAEIKTRPQEKTKAS